MSDARQSNKVTSTTVGHILSANIRRPDVEERIALEKAREVLLAFDIYTLYVDDDRYSVPTIDILEAEGDEEAKRLAARRLASSPHYLAITVWQDDRLVWELTAPDGQAAADEQAGSP